MEKVGKNIRDHRLYAVYQRFILSNNYLLFQGQPFTQYIRFRICFLCYFYYHPPSPQKINKSKIRNLVWFFFPYFFSVESTRSPGGTRGDREFNFPDGSWCRRGVNYGTLGVCSVAAQKRIIYVFSSIGPGASFRGWRGCAARLPDPWLQSGEGELYYPLKGKRIGVRTLRYLYFLYSTSRILIYRTYFRIKSDKTAPFAALPQTRHCFNVAWSRLNIVSTVIVA